MKGGEVSLGMERSLSLLAALSGPGRRAQPVGKAVGMLGWIGEAMPQVLRKVGEHARACGRSLRAALDLPAIAVQDAGVADDGELAQEGGIVGGADTGFLTPPVAP